MPKNNFFDEPQEPSEQKIVLPKHHGWIWALVIVVVLALAGGAIIYTQKNNNSQYLVTDFASCVRANGGRVAESFPAQCHYYDQVYIDPDHKAIMEQQGTEPRKEETSIQPKLLIYAAEAGTFSLSYPDTLTQTEADVATPYTNTPVDITSQIFSHSIPVEYCNPRGDCVPSTTDFSISFTVVNSSVATISASPKMEGVADIIFGANKFKYLEQGAEGEGIVYYFISLPSGKSLMIARKFLDENTLIKYQTAANFIKKADQDKIAQQILTSLTFTAAN